MNYAFWWEISVEKKSRRKVKKRRNNLRDHSQQHLWSCAGSQSSTSCKSPATPTQQHSIMVNRRSKNSSFPVSFNVYRSHKLSFSVIPVLDDAMFCLISNWQWLSEIVISCRYQYSLRVFELVNLSDWDLR